MIAESPVVIGGVYNFSLKKDGRPLASRNHVCKVEVMRWDGSYFLCRRVDNGTPILAFESDLEEPSL